MMSFDSTFKNLRSISVLACLSIAFCTTAMAQPRVPRRFDTSIVLIGLPEVIEELDVGSGQARLIEALEADLTEQIGIRDNQTRTERRTINTKLWNAVLEKKQAKRFAEIKLQFDSLYAVERESFVKALGLTDDQVDRIRRVRRDRDETFAEEPATAVADILSKEQEKEWSDRLGKRFEFSEEALEFHGFLRFRFRRR